MRAIILLVSLVLALSSAQQIYSPGINVGIKDWLIFKIRDEILPEVMEEFKQITFPDQGVVQDHYEVKVYGMEADIIPLTKEQITIITDEAQNTLTVEIDNFQMSFEGHAYARALFVSTHGEAAINVKIEKISFTVEPRLIVDGELNRLDYNIDAIALDIKAGDIKFTKLTLGVLPSWLLTSLTNVIVESATFVFHEFEGIFDKIVVKVLDKWRVSIPDSIVIPGTKFSASLSFPNVPRLKADRIELPLDGTIYVTEQGYTPTTREITEMPSFHTEDPNNIQIFLHQYTANTALKSIASSATVLRVDNKVLEQFGLATDVLFVKWLSHLFPKLLCSFDKEAEVSIDLGIDPNLVNDIEFSSNKIQGKISPSFKFLVGEEHAFTLSFTGEIDVDVAFGVADKITKVTGTVNVLDMHDMTFVAGKVPDIELSNIINIFKGTAEVYAIGILNNILAAGITIPIIPVIKEAFEVDIDSVELVLQDQHLAASLTVDISTKERLFNMLTK